MNWFSGQIFQNINATGRYFNFFYFLRWGLRTDTFIFFCLLKVSTFSEHAELSKVSITGRRDLWC